MILVVFVVRVRGFEPPWIAPLRPKRSVSSQFHHTRIFTTFTNKGLVRETRLELVSLAAAVFETAVYAVPPLSLRGEYLCIRAFQ